jgi:regulator of protease activity HflC (stomatin/prohibitin superfamily)
MFFHRKFIVRKHERGLLFKQGDFVRFLEPGIYRLFDPLMRLKVELHDIVSPQFEHRLADFFVKQYPADVERLFVKVETRDHDVAVIFKNGHFAEVIGPDKRELFWKGVVDVTVQVINIADTFDVDPRVAKALIVEFKGARVALDDKAIFIREVPDGHVGLLHVDGELVRQLAPGLHVFWKFNRGIAVALVDLRVRALEVGGQEILTKDKVSLRINLIANYQFTDALQAAKAAKDPLDFLYKELQFGLRAAVGTRTLDALLEDKGAVDQEVFKDVRDKFAEIGIEVRGIGVKDIILPGDMKDILGKVVAAEKVAQANVIRRREETNATRSLLNTAKVMEDNPVALRLKELETLEKVTEKVGNISVYGGLDGVLDQIVRIKR